MADKQAFHIEDEKDYQHTISALSSGSRPAAILRLLMGALEAYRASRKLGWSRPWNKYDVVNFQSFRLRPEEDRPLIELGRRVLEQEFSPLPDEAAGFIDSLLGDPGLMGFVFCHETGRDGQFWEGANLSLGRKVERRYRDRLDIILESEIRDGVSTGLSRIRVYLDPYRGRPGPPQWEWSKTETAGQAASALFTRLAEISWQWPGEERRSWDHWTSRYIDYFGERRHAPGNSYFQQPDPQPRASHDTPQKRT